MRSKLAVCSALLLAFGIVTQPVVTSRAATSSGAPALEAYPTPEIVIDRTLAETLPASRGGANGSAGELRAISGGALSENSCPLRRTDVRARVSGFVARVDVTQEFVNSRAESVEAVYTFPLPHRAAVDRMTIRVGTRTVRGRVMRREEARTVYEAARERGSVAALLDEERPNIFTQSVANIPPGGRVVVELSYVELLNYERGAYEFVFPMTVGPRYIPGPLANDGGRRASRATERVPDAARITPPVAPEGVRAGHDISLHVSIDAGVPVTRLTSVLHDVQVRAADCRRVDVRLRDRAEIPNRDFVLRYATAGGRIESGLLAHRDDARGGFFTLILQPPARVGAEDLTPKELVFVLDTSGSMEGFPIEKAKETMRLALDGLHPRDTFNLITFSGDTHVLFPAPVPATPENLELAQAFLAGRAGAGGTEMMEAVRAALAPSGSPSHVRVVCFMTDGRVGNDFEIISEVQRHPAARVFSFGIGNAPNRFLLDKMAEEGRGEVEYVTLEEDGSIAARRFHERVRSPLLTDISIDWGGISVSETFPRRVPDLFDARPIIVVGRYARGGRGTVSVRGRAAGREVTQEFAVELPDSQSENDALASVWARQKIDHLMGGDYAGLQSGTTDTAIEESITRLGLDFGLMTKFTSLVAVEELIVNEGGRQRRVEVPVELPSGVSHEGVYGESYATHGAPGLTNATAEAFTISEMCKSLGPVILAVLLLLALMALFTLAVACERTLRLALAGSRSRRRSRGLARSLRRGDWQEAVASFDNLHAGSPLDLAADHFAARLSSRDPSAALSRAEIESVELALRRDATALGADLRRGLSGLAAVGSTAPLVGLFGTIFGLIAAFTGMRDAESAGIGAVAGGIAEALMTTALSLGVAVPAVWLLNYFTGKADRVVSELENSSSELIEFFLRERARKLRRHA